MTTVSIQLPEEVFFFFFRPLAEFVQRMRLAAAIHWYSRAEVSMEKAALIAGLDRADFLEALAREQVDVFEVNMESLQRELDRV